MKSLLLALTTAHPIKYPLDITKVDLANPTIFNQTIETIHFATPQVFKPGTLLNSTYSIGNTKLGETTASLCNQRLACVSDQFKFVLEQPFNIPPVIEVKITQVVYHDDVQLAMTQITTTFTK